jgi:hypothetical protein
LDKTLVARKAVAMVLREAEHLEHTSAVLTVGMTVVLMVVFLAETMVPLKD